MNELFLNMFCCVVTLSLPAMKKSSRNLAMSREPIICKHLLPVV